MSARYVLKRAAGSQYMFNLKAGNGETILTSENYASKQGAHNGIASVRIHSPQDGNYRESTASNGQFFFVLVASNGETLGRSETYTTQAARDTGIQSVKTNGPAAPVNDET